MFLFINKIKVLSKHYRVHKIEGSNIEYGDFEKWNIDTKLTSKI